MGYGLWAMGPLTPKGGKGVRAMGSYRGYLSPMGDASLL